MVHIDETLQCNDGAGNFVWLAGYVIHALLNRMDQKVLLGAQQSYPNIKY